VEESKPVGKRRLVDPVCADGDNPPVTWAIVCGWRAYSHAISAA